MQRQLKQSETSPADDQPSCSSDPFMSSTDRFTTTFPLNFCHRSHSGLNVYPCRYSRAPSACTGELDDSEATTARGRKLSIFKVFTYFEVGMLTSYNYFKRSILAERWYRSVKCHNRLSFRHRVLNKTN